MGEGGNREQVVKDLRAFLKKLECALLRSSHGRFREWISRSLRTGTGALHRFSKTFGGPAQGLAEVQSSDGRLLTDPLEINTAKAEAWAVYWKAERNPPPLPGWWPRLLQRAQEEEAPEITEDEVISSLQCFRGGSGWEATDKIPTGGDSFQTRR